MMTEQPRADVFSYLIRQQLTSRVKVPRNGIFGSILDIFSPLYSEGTWKYIGINPHGDVIAESTDLVNWTPITPHSL